MSNILIFCEITFLYCGHLSKNRISKTYFLKIKETESKLIFFWSSETFSIETILKWISFCNWRSFQNATLILSVFEVFDKDRLAKTRKLKSLFCEVRSQKSNDTSSKMRFNHFVKIINYVIFGGSLRWKIFLKTYLTWPDLT